MFAQQEAVCDTSININPASAGYDIAFMATAAVRQPLVRYTCRALTPLTLCPTRVTPTPYPRRWPHAPQRACLCHVDGCRDVSPGLRLVRLHAWTDIDAFNLQHDGGTRGTPPTVRAY